MFYCCKIDCFIYINALVAERNRTVLSMIERIATAFSENFIHTYETITQYLRLKVMTFPRCMQIKRACGR